MPTGKGAQGGFRRGKREEYKDIILQKFDSFSQDAVINAMDSRGKSVIELSEFEKKNLKQIKIDVLRTQPDVDIFKNP